MNTFCYSNMQKNKLIVLIVLLLFALLSVHMPHGSVETYQHHNHERLFKHVVNKNKPAAKLRKLLKKLRSFLLRIFRLPQILSKLVVSANNRLVLFNMRFFKVSILDLFSFLCCYFHGSKFKHSMNHSDLLPSMAV